MVNIPWIRFRQLFMGISEETEKRRDPALIQMIIREQSVRPSPKCYKVGWPTEEGGSSRWQLIFMANKERNTTDDGDGNNAPDSVINHPPHLPLTILTTVSLSRTDHRRRYCRYILNWTPIKYLSINPFWHHHRHIVKQKDEWNGLLRYIHSCVCVVLVILVRVLRLFE